MSKQGREMDGRTETDGQQKSRRLELSAAQVAGSALAAVAAAVLASRLGVYGTILGAGLVSVVATAGGSLFQHVFRRTGEQIKEARDQTRPPRRGGRGAAAPSTERGVWNAPTTHGTRLRGGRRPALAAVAVFAVAMVAITGIEWASGGPVSNVWGGDRGGTTVGESFHRPQGSSGSDDDRRPSDTRSDDPSRDRGPSSPSPSPERGGDGDTGRRDNPSPGPSRSSGGGGEDGDTTPDTTPGTSDPTPSPSGSPSRSAPDGSDEDAGTTTPEPDFSAGE
ncbi:hypothetical protein [Streptomyces cucumeris]|uniref:hypothetical protein n=1 Tax=Streptomyces cucumeris TaxID=2962890 RepID=UPI0020C87920|nr:hypothetical protein [Streptomyces sp. NEAU-Y11]MCP9205640.1 hypothetical protein [Streptomyces sp. NEAU-Y11]